MRKLKITTQLKSIAIRFFIYSLIVYFGVVLNYVPHTWIVTFAVLSFVVSVSFISTEVKHKWIYMSLIVIFAILFTNYYLEPRNEVFRKKYNRIVNDFNTLPEEEIKKIKIIYYKRGDTYYNYGEYTFII